MNGSVFTSRRPIAVAAFGLIAMLSAAAVLFYVAVDSLAREAASIADNVERTRGIHLALPFILGLCALIIAWRRPGNPVGRWLLLGSVFARTLEAFSARLREEVDLDALGDELLDVIGRTMQPTNFSLWLKNTHTRRGP